MEDANVVEASGDRFADVVSNVNLLNAVEHVLPYVAEIFANDEGDVEAKHCLTMLLSLKENAASAIGDEIE